MLGRSEWLRKPCRWLDGERMLTASEVALLPAGVRREARESLGARRRTRKEVSCPTNCSPCVLPPSGTGTT